MDGEEITLEHNFTLSKSTRPKPPKPSQSPNLTPPPPTVDLEIERPGQNANEEEDSTAAFADLGLVDWIVKTCTELSIQKPTVVQSRCIPKILEGKDVLGIPEIGSGKTVGFALPFGIFALVITPTRELVFQLVKQFRALGSSLSV